MVPAITLDDTAMQGEAADAVPFRLTRSLYGAIGGAAGAEGVFASALEELASALMAERRVLKPLLAIHLRTNMLLQQQNGPCAPVETAVAATMASLAEIVPSTAPADSQEDGEESDMKRRALDLIKQATATDNLARMPAIYQAWV